MRARDARRSSRRTRRSACSRSFSSARPARSARSPRNAASPAAVRRLGDDVVFYASDVPHWDHDYPEGLREMATREDLSLETRRKILADNSRRLYARTTSAPAPR